MSLGFGGSPARGDDRPVWADLEKMVLDARRAIVKGHFEIVRRCDSKHAGVMHHEHVRHTIFIDGQKFRHDRSYLADDGSALARDSLAFNGEHYFEFHDRPAKRISYVQVYDYGSLPEHSRTFPDPRKIGLFPDDLTSLEWVPDDLVLGNGGRSDAPVERADIDGTPCWLARYTVPSKTGTLQVHAWVDAVRGHPLKLRAEQTYQTDSGPSHWVNELNLVLAQRRPGSEWFPSNYTSRVTANDSLEREERATVRVYSLNEPIDPSVFELRGMGVPAGIVVTTLTSDRRHQGRQVWNGRDVVPASDLPATAGQFEFSGVALPLVSVVAAVIFAVCLWLLLRQRKKDAA
jgi:hypothetical protein